jgi:hypothetical protein
MNSLPDMLPRFGVDLTILLSSVSLTLFGQTTPTGAPFQIATPSNGEPIPSKIDFAVAVEAGWLHPNPWMKTFG